MCLEVLLTSINFCGGTKKKEFQTKVGNSNMRESDEQIKPKLCFVSH